MVLPACALVERGAPMALRVVLSVAPGPPPYSCAWLTQRRSASALLHPIDLVITDQHLAMKSAIVVECGPEEMHSFGFIHPYLFRPLLQQASASASPIKLSMTLKPQGNVELSLQWIAQPPTCAIISDSTQLHADRQLHQPNFTMERATIRCILRSRFIYFMVLLCVASLMTSFT